MKSIPPARPPMGRNWGAVSAPWLDKLTVLRRII